MTDAGSGQTSTDDPWRELAERLRAERERLGLTTTDLAKLVDVSRTTISNWENGKRMPIERCAALAEALAIDQDVLLALHPESVPLHVGGPNVSNGAEGTMPSAPNTFHQDLARSRWTWVAAASVALLAAVMGIVQFRPSGDGCVAVGDGSDLRRETFRETFAQMGGEARLGCAVNAVHQWGPGHVQDLDGGSAGRSIIMSVDPSRAFVVAGELWRDYESIAGGATAAVAGLVDSPPHRCGDAVVVLLSGGLTGEGALIANGGDDQYVWLSGDIWRAYQDIGGPGGAYGAPLPVGMERSDSGARAAFEHGEIVHTYGRGTRLKPVPAQSTPLRVEECAPA